MCQKITLSHIGYLSIYPSTSLNFFKCRIQSAQIIILQAFKFIVNGKAHKQITCRRTIIMEVSRLENSSLREEYVLKLWDSYILDNLVEADPCQIGIYDVRTKRRITSSDGFWVSPKELEVVIEGVTYPDIVQRNGLVINGKTYDVRLADGKNGIFARKEFHGCTVCKTFTLLIIAVTDERYEAKVCNEQVMKLGDFLRRAGL